MDISSLVERIKSSKVLAIALGVLVIVAGGGAYFFYGYEPQNETPAAKPVVAKKPQPAPAKPAATPASAVPAAPTQSAPPAVPAGQQPPAAAAPGAAAPSQGPDVPAAKPMAAVQSDEPKKQAAETKPEVSAKPEQAGKSEQSGEPDNSLDTPEKSRKTEATSDVEPPANVEAAPVVAEEPIRQRGGITPKYNDIMTPVLRGDRDAVKQLLDLGWWADKPEPDGTTPLMAAVMNRDTQMVQLLLDHGAEPSPQAIRIARKNKDLATAALLEQKAAAR